jgi:hypothetical protein
MLLVFTKLKKKNPNINYKDKSYEHIMLNISKILLLIFFILLNKVHLSKRNKNFLNLELKNRSYSLYNYFKYPQISIIIPDVDSWELKNQNILKLIENLRNQTLNNIEIILTSTKVAFKEYKKIKNLCLSDNRIKFEKNRSKNSISNIFSLINLLKGKFVLIIYKFFNFKSIDFEKCYNFTKGKINNIFEFKIKKESLYLIKSKILRKINDKNLNFNNFSDLLQYITSLPEPQLNYIPVALSTNNYYISLAYVCMTSILYSKSVYTLK